MKMKVATEGERVFRGCLHCFFLANLLKVSSLQCYQLTANEIVWNLPAYPILASGPVLLKFLLMASALFFHVSMTGSVKTFHTIASELWLQLEFWLAVSDVIAMVILNPLC